MKAIGQYQICIQLGGLPGTYLEISGCLAVVNYWVKAELDISGEWIERRDLVLSKEGRRIAYKSVGDSPSFLRIIYRSQAEVQDPWSRYLTSNIWDI
jgi:hypothetical protein